MGGHGMGVGGSERLEKLAGRMKREIENGAAPHSEKPTVREFLSWFGYSRRGRRAVNEIRHLLAEYNLRTVPDFEVTWIDEEITVERDPETTDGTPASEEKIDPTVRVGVIEAARRKPTAVKPTNPLSVATTLMLTNDFSQLPVMESDREVKGAISWQSIGTRLSLGHTCASVGDCMDPSFPEIDINAPLSSAIESISRQGYVLVRGNDKTITGIVTASDVTRQFMQLSGPFLNIGEIEGYLRILVHRKFTIEEMQAALPAAGGAQPISGPEDLTLGGYCRLFEREELWNKLGLELDRKEFVKRLHWIREIRNDVMHFDPDGIDPNDTKKLEEIAQFFRNLRRVGAI